MTPIQSLMADFARLEKETLQVQEHLQAQAWRQLKEARKAYEDHMADLADGRPDSYAPNPEAMPVSKRYLFLTKSLYVCSDGRVICSETPGRVFTEADALQGRDPDYPPADFRLDFSR